MFMSVVDVPALMLMVLAIVVTVPLLFGSTVGLFHAAICALLFWFCVQLAMEVPEGYVS